MIAAVVQPGVVELLREQFRVEADRGRRFDEMALSGHVLCFSCGEVFADWDVAGRLFEVSNITKRTLGGVSEEIDEWFLVVPSLLGAAREGAHDEKRLRLATSIQRQDPSDRMLIYLGMDGGVRGVKGGFNRELVDNWKRGKEMAEGGHHPSTASHTPRQELRHFLEQGSRSGVLQRVEVLAAAYLGPEFAAYQDEQGRLFAVLPEALSLKGKISMVENCYSSERTVEAFFIDSGEIYCLTMSDSSVSKVNWISPKSRKGGIRTRGGFFEELILEPDLIG